MPTRPGTKCKTKHKQHKSSTHPELSHLKGKEYSIWVNRKRTYGIGIEEYNNLFNEQNGKCAICGMHQSDLNRTLSIDHCHINNNVRGLLCNNCNVAIGLLKEDIEIVKNVLIYLKKTKINLVD